MKFFLSLLMLLSVLGFSAAQGYKPARGETVLKVEVEGRGSIYIKLYTDKAPKTCAQIMKLAKSGFYNGQKFFRVTKSPRPFLVQAGDPLSKTNIDDPKIGTGGSGTRIPYEDSGLSNERGAVGLATISRQDKDSGDSQFYIMLDTNTFLDGNYTVFGKVVSGMDVVDHLEKGDKITSATIL